MEYYMMSKQVFAKDAEQKTNSSGSSKVQLTASKMVRAQQLYSLTYNRPTTGYGEKDF